MMHGAHTHTRNSGDPSLQCVCVIYSATVRREYIHLVNCALLLLPAPYRDGGNKKNCC